MLFYIHINGNFRNHRNWLRDHSRATHHFRWGGNPELGEKGLGPGHKLERRPDFLAQLPLLFWYQHCHKERQLFLTSQPGISLGNLLRDLDVLLWPGPFGCGTCRSWALVHSLLPTPCLARQTESNSNHVLNRNLVNQKPGWGDSRGERRGLICWQQGRPECWPRKLDS